MSYFINFEENYATYNGKKGSKKSIYESLVSYRRKNKIKMFHKSEVLTDFILYTFKIKGKKSESTIYVNVDKKDAYVSKLNDIMKITPISSIITTSVSVVLLAYVLIKTPKFKEKVKVKNFEMEEVTLDDFFSLEDAVDEYDKTFDKKEESYIKLLQVDKTMNACFHQVSKKEIDHDIDEFYDSGGQNFKLGIMYERLRDNSKKNAQLMTGESLELFSEEELFNIAVDLSRFIDKCKKECPDFDVKKFICNLKDASFYKNTKETPNYSSMYGSYGEYSVIYHTFQDEEEFDTFRWKHVSYHEYLHLAQDSCSCNHQGFMANGVSIKTDTSLDKVYPNISTIQPYALRFMEEYASEKGSAVLLGEDTATYAKEMYVADTLEYILSLNPNYKIGTMLHCNINSNPILFYQQFPYVYDVEKELEEYVCMLNSLDYALGYGIEDIYSVIGDNGLTYYDISMRYQKYAEEKEADLFYKNLAASIKKEHYLDTQYIYYQIHLFHMAMKDQEKYAFQRENKDLEQMLYHKYVIFYENYIKNDTLLEFEDKEDYIKNVNYPVWKIGEDRYELIEKLKTIHENGLPRKNHELLK